MTTQFKVYSSTQDIFLMLSITNKQCKILVTVLEQ
uniref:Uncharacterized protein n=1 Tax=Arundo donax TaxID=35708 RepID=A0A0A9B4S0_ARUDO